MRLVIYHSKIMLMVLVSVIPLSCKKGTRPDLLQPTLFAKIYTDIISQSLDSTASDSLAQVQNILDRYRVGRAVFDTTLAEYERRPEIWVDILDQVTKDLESREKKSPASSKQ